jgi:two-component system response regulator PilR (NtrC family)
MSKILIVDDEPNMRRILKANLRTATHTCIEASCASEAISLLSREGFDVVVTDQKMPGGTGLDVLRAVQESDSTTSVIFLTAVGTVELAVESMRQGAFDFLTKPFDIDVMKATIRRACERTYLLRENVVLKTTVRKLEGAEEILGESQSIRSVRDLVARVARTNSTVLITGETGTGKELVARAIHRNSLRAQRPFIAINCAAVTETLLESELFGHERGAFTGADKSRAGLFEAAHEGTLFLDEVAEMSPAAQAKLLRVLANGEIQRVGSTVTRKVDVRVLVATHRDLQGRVHEGLFREDLFYRLAVLPIQLPPLRERKEDIEVLCTMLSSRIAREMKVPCKTLSPEALKKLESYSFPGNVRELGNLLERALILGQYSELRPEDFLLSMVDLSSSPSSKEFTIEQLAAQFPEQIDLRDAFTRLERTLSIRAIDSSRGVQAEAARRLGLSRSDFGYKLSRHSISGKTQA